MISTLIFRPNLRLAGCGHGPRWEVVREGKENRDRDYVEKRREYAEAEIAEYWIVDPQERQVTVLVLDGTE